MGVSTAHERTEATIARAATLFEPGNTSPADLENAPGGLSVQ